MRASFKEWAIVVDALGRGEQIFILRKGGIHEGRGGFKPEYPEFLLFPTLFHQQRESVLPPAQARYDEIAPQFPSPDNLRLRYWAKLVEAEQVKNFEAVRRLAGQHIWREEILRERFEWGKERAIHALALRIYQLPAAINKPMLPEYAGCKSWIELAEDLNTAGSRPVLDDVSFTPKLAALRDALA